MSHARARQHHGPASSMARSIERYRSSRAALCKANMTGVSAMIERSGQRAPRRFDRPTDLVFRIHRIAWELGTGCVRSSRLPAHERARPFEPCCLGPFLLGLVSLSLYLSVGSFLLNLTSAHFVLPRAVSLNSFIPFDSCHIKLINRSFAICLKFLTSRNNFRYMTLIIILKKGDRIKFFEKLEIIFLFILIDHRMI